MSSLSDALQGLFDFLKKQVGAPPTREVCVLEIGADTNVDQLGRFLIRPSELREPGGYETRFEVLMKSGLPWINVSCVGVIGGKLVVGIEFPRPSSESSARTSLNYSGPVKAVLDENWNADPVLVLQ
jgi:hypothetical protein